MNSNQQDAYTSIGPQRKKRDRMTALGISFIIAAIVLISLDTFMNKESSIQKPERTGQQPISAFQIKVSK